MVQRRGWALAPADAAETGHKSLAFKRMNAPADNRPTPGEMCGGPCVDEQLWGASLGARVDAFGRPLRTMKAPAATEKSTNTVRELERKEAHTDKFGNPPSPINAFFALVLVMVLVGLARQHVDLGKMANWVRMEWWGSRRGG